MFISYSSLSSLHLISSLYSHRVSSLMFTSYSSFLLSLPHFSFLTSHNYHLSYAHLLLLFFFIAFCHIFSFFTLYIISYVYSLLFFPSMASSSASSSSASERGGVRWRWAAAACTGQPGASPPPVHHAHAGTGMLVCWCAGLWLCWCIGVLVCWCDLPS